MTKETWFTDLANKIIEMIKKTVGDLEIKELEKFIQLLLLTKAKGKKVVVIGAGRSGLIGRAFAMRLMHLGFDTYVFGETITPAVEKDDLIIAISGSGSTKLVLTSAELAKGIGAKILAILSHADSPLGRLANNRVIIKGRTKAVREEDYFSRQILGEHEPLAPMGTL
ncbi:MAG TPA: SIS domain-containing protein, partial [Candidatus Bathyarchaeia archaeon]|nr:SIS domain-containing protein [Candidatus Bathyarchaeia archaeon]